MIKVTVFRMIDYEILGDKTHVSISGGVATHNLYQVDEFTVDWIGQVLPKIKLRHDCIPYIFDDRLEFQLSDSESLSFYLEEITNNKIDNQELKNHFPNLEY